MGAARGAGIGAGIYGSFEEAFQTLEKRKTIEPSEGASAEAYAAWKELLNQVCN